MNLFPALCVMSALAFGQATTTTTSTSTTTAKPAAKAAAKAGAKAGRTVEITTGDNMKYDVTEITAKPGESLRVVVKNTGAMPKIAMAHNFVLLKAGTDVAEFTKAAFNALYLTFLGRPNGPRAGWLLASLERDFVIGRLTEAGAAGEAIG